MSDMEQIWREKSDEDLLEAAATLSDFTAEGQRVIRAELKRRGLEDPIEQVGQLASEPSPSEAPAGEPATGGPADAESSPAEELTLPEPECLRCHREMEYRGTRTMLGEVGNLFSHSDVFDLYVCPKCGHVELFASEMES